MFTAAAKLVDAPDRIWGWGARDVIDLSAIDADAGADGDQAFVLVQGDPAGSPEAGVLYVAAAGGEVTLHADVNGDGAWDLAILVETGRAIGAGDLVL